MCNAEILKTYTELNGITEPLHTFAKWQSLGYSIKKGEKASHKITIWKNRKGTATTENEHGEKVESEYNRQFMKVAHFFTLSQVEKAQPTRKIIGKLVKAS